MPAEQPSPKRRIPVGRRAVYALVVLVALILGAEGALRLTLPAARRASLPNEMIQAHLDGAAYRYDPDLFWYWSDPGQMGSPVNAYGFVRAVPMSREKPAGVTRVITFGDSQTFGAGMRPDQTYSAFAETELGSGWEVLNAGISGYRTLNVYRLLRLRMLAFSPDAVVIDCMPFDSPRDDGSLEGRPLVSSRSDALKRLLWHSRLYYVLRLGLEVLNPARARWLDDPHAAEDAAAAQKTGGRGVDPRGGGVPVMERMGNHELIAEWGAAHGVTVFFMQYPIMDEQGNHGCMTGPDELPPNARVIPTCERLQATGRPAPALFQDRNHLTEEGNRLVGGIVADALRAWAAER